MKRAFNYISVFILFISLFSGAFFVGESKTNVVNAVSNYITESKKEGNGTNYIEITPEGKITVKYTWEGTGTKGIAYLIIAAAECSKYSTDKNTGAYILDEDGKRICEGKYGWHEKIIFASGDVAVKNIINGKAKIRDSKTVNLFNYYEYNALVQISVYTGFFSGAPSVDKRIIPSKNPYIKDDDQVTPFVRTTAGGNFADAEIECLDKRMETYTTTDTKKISSVVISVENSAAKDATSDIEKIIFDTVIPALLLVLGLAAAVTLCALGYQIVKEADDASQRSENIQRIRNILIGIVAAFVILMAMEPFIKLMEKLIKE